MPNLVNMFHKNTLQTHEIWDPKLANFTKKCMPGGNACPLAYISYVDSPSWCRSIFILHQNIHATRVITLSAEELDTMTKNNLRGITLGIKAHMGN